MSPLLVIGCGYAGRVLRKRVPASLGTALPGENQGDEIPFELKLDSDWNLLPPAKNLIVTCKIDSVALAIRIRDDLLPRYQRCLFLSSAASLRCSGPRLDESAGPADSPRAQAEAILAPVAPLLALGLITGPGRETAKWLQEGRIASRHKIVNFIPVDELVSIALKILMHPESPRGWILCSDGRPRTWGEVATELGLELPPDVPPQRDSRAFDIRRLEELMKAAAPG